MSELGWFVVGAAAGIGIAIPLVYFVVRWRSRVLVRSFMADFNKHTFYVGDGPTEPPILKGSERASNEA